MTGALKEILLFKEMFIIICKPKRKIQGHSDSDSEQLQARFIRCYLLLRDAIFLLLWLLSVKISVCHALC